MEKCRCGRYDTWNGISWAGHNCDYKESRPRQQEKQKQRRPNEPTDDVDSPADASTSRLGGCLGCVGLLVIIGAIWGIDGFGYLLKAVIAVVLVTFEELGGWIESH